MKPAGPGQSALLLSEVVSELDNLGLRYAVIGALAASFHGVVRSSLDADAVVSGAAEPGLVEKLISRLRERGWSVEHRPGAFDDPIDSVIAVTDGFENRVDLLTGIRGMSSDFISRTVKAALLGVKLKMIGAEDFIAMKVFAGGPRDLEDARGVMEVSGGSIDYSLLKRLAAKYGPRTMSRLNDLLEASPKNPPA